MKKIYLNNSATSYPKPDRVKASYVKYLDAVPPSQFRSSLNMSSKDFQSSLSVEGGKREVEDILVRTRRSLGLFFNCSDSGKIHFTSGATESLNAIIGGLYKEGNHFVSTVTEHNSVLRPLFNLCSPRDFTLVPCDREGYVSPAAVKRSIRKETKAIIVNHASNVTGSIQDVAAIGRIAREAEVLFIVDASQSAGCIPVDIDRNFIDILAFTGHKSLMGVPGTGGFYLRNSLSFRPLKFGGTGQRSKMLLYSEGEIDYEPGTPNYPGIAALNEGIAFLNNIGIDAIQEKEGKLRRRLWDSLTDIPGIELYGSKNRPAAPVVSFTYINLAPSDLANILYGSYGIIGRAGFHCSPEIHKALETYSTGTMRISFSWFTTEEEIDGLISAVRDIDFRIKGFRSL